MSTHDGDFYIDNDTGDFYLHEFGAWAYKGNIRGSGGSFDVDGPLITGSGPPPVGGVVGKAVITGAGPPI